MRIVLGSKIERINQRFNVAKIEEDIIYAPKYNIKSGDDTYVISNNQKRQIEIYNWGLTGIKDSIKPITSVRAEGDRNKQNDPNYHGANAIFLQKAYRKILESQRCLVLADAFILGKESETPYLFYLRNKNRPFALAGIYTQNAYDEKSFAIISCGGNRLIRHLGHQRMPVIVPIEYESRWLRTSTHLTDVLDCLYPCPTELMNAYRISTDILQGSANNIQLITPISQPIFNETIKTYQFTKKKKAKTTNKVAWAEQVKSARK